LHVIWLGARNQHSVFKAVNLVKTVNLVNLAGTFFMAVADLPAKLHEVLQVDLQANLPAGFSSNRKPSHSSTSLAQTSFASARNPRRYESLWA
jgi:hypothetical protein